MILLSTCGYSGYRLRSEASETLRNNSLWRIVLDSDFQRLVKLAVRRFWLLAEAAVDAAFIMALSLLLAGVVRGIEELGAQAPNQLEFVDQVVLWSGAVLVAGNFIVRIGRTIAKDW